MTAVPTSASLPNGSRLREPIVSMIVIETWLSALEGIVPDPEALGVEAGLDPKLRGNADLFVPRTIEHGIVERAVEQCGPEIGLIAAQRTGKGAFGLVEYLVRTSPTLAIGLDHLARFGGLLGAPPAMVRSADSRDAITFTRGRPDPGIVEDCIAEFALGSVAWLGRNATEQAWQPDFVSFEHRERGSKARYQAVFRCPVRFSADTTTLAFASRDLALPMRDADRRLHKILRDAAALLPGPHEVGSPRFSDKVELVLADSIRAAQRMSLLEVARRLGLTTRAVQYRLRRENLSFRAVLDRARDKVARRLLATTDLTVPEIAYLLGYSEPAPFHRAFRRWTGVTPTQHRAKLPFRKP